MIGLEALYAAGVPVVLGWTEIVKRAVPDRWHRFVPLLAVALGVLYAFVNVSGRGAVERVMVGAMIGLGAAGAFDGTRAVMEKAAPRSRKAA